MTEEIINLDEPRSPEEIINLDEAPINLDVPAEAPAEIQAAPKQSKEGSFMDKAREFADDPVQSVLGLIGQAGGAALGVTKDALRGAAAVTTGQTMRAMEETRKAQTQRAEEMQVNVPGRDEPLKLVGPVALIRAQDKIQVALQDPTFAKWGGIKVDETKLTSEEKDKRGQYLEANAKFIRQLNALKKPDEPVFDLSYRVQPADLEKFGIRSAAKDKPDWAQFQPVMTDEEIGAIAHQYNVPVEFLENRLPMMRAVKEGQENDPAVVAGLIGAQAGQIFSNPGLAIDMKLWPHKQNEREALTALNALIESRRSPWATTSDVVTGIGGGIAATSAYGPRLANLALKLGMTANQSKNLVTAADISDNMLQALSAGAQLQDYDQLYTDAAALPVLIGTVTGLPAFARMAKLPAGQVMTKLLNKNEEAVMKQAPRLLFNATEQAAQDAQTAAPYLSAKFKQYEQIPKGQPVPITPTELDIARRMGATGDEHEVVAFVNKAVHNQPGLMEQTYRFYKTEQLFDEQLLKTVQELPRNGGRLLRVADALSSSYWLSHIYDKQLGTRSAETIVNAHNAGRASAILFADRGQEALDAMKSISRFKPANMDQARWEDMLISHMDGRAVSNDPAVQAAAKEVSQLLTGWRNFYNQTGRIYVDDLMASAQQKAGGQQVTAYIPRRLLPAAELAVNAKQRLDKAFQQVGGQGSIESILQEGSQKDHAAMATIMGDKNNADIMQILNLAAGKEIGTTEDFFKAARQVLNPGQEWSRHFDTSTVAAAKAMKERVGVLPEWAMDKNLGRVLMGYVEDFNNIMFTEPHVQAFEHFARIAEKKALARGGDAMNDPAAQYFRAQANTLRYGGAGQAGGIGAYQQKLGQRVDLDLLKREKAYQASGEPRKAQAIRTMREAVPMVSDFVNRNLYSAYLGVHNIKATLQNFATPILGTMDEEGLAYGSELAAKSLVTAYKRFAGAGGWSASVTGREPSRAVLRSQVAAGLSDRMNEEIMQLARGEFDKAVKTSERGARSMKAAQTAMMTTFNISERFSREMAYAMGEQLANDIVAGKPRALRAMRAMPGSQPMVVERMAANVKSGAITAEQFQHYLGGHMVERTVLNYDDLAKAQAARYLGGAFSQFTRWPTEFAGQMNYGLRNDPKGVAASGARMAMKYLPGLSLLASATRFILEGEDKKDMGGRAKAVMGATGLEGWHSTGGPALEGLKAISGQKTGDTKFTPPYVGFAQDWIKAAGLTAFGEEGDNEEAVGRALDSLLKLGVPGYGVLSGLGRTAEMLANDEASPE